MKGNDVKTFLGARPVCAKLKLRFGEGRPRSQEKGFGGGLLYGITYCET